MTQNLNYQEGLSKCKTMGDITGQYGLIKKIIKDSVKHVLGQELKDYIKKKKMAIRFPVTVRLLKI